MTQEEADTQLFYMQFSTKWQCLSISKNGSTLLASCLFTDKTKMFIPKIIYKKLSVLWNIYCLPYVSCHLISDYKTFIVWRDPVSRFKSLFKDTLLGQHDDILIKMNLTKDDLIKDTKVFVEICLKKVSNNEIFDKHIDSQNQQLLRSEIDLNNFTIVKIEDLNKFVENELKQDPNNFHKNSSKNLKFDLSQFDEQIKNAYLQDYKMLETYKNKIYKL